MILNILLLNLFQSIGFNDYVSGAFCLPSIALFGYVINSRFVFLKKVERR